MHEHDTEFSEDAPETSAVDRCSEPCATLPSARLPGTMVARVQNLPLADRQMGRVPQLFREAEEE